MARAVLACAVVLACASVAAAVPGVPPFTPPVIADTFYASVQVSEWPGPEVDVIAIYSDVAGQRFLSLSNETNANGETYVTADLHNYNAPANKPTEWTYVGALQQCTAAHPPGDAFPSMFGWVKDAVYDGQTMVYDQLCDVWTLNRDAGQFVMSLYTVAGADPNADVVPVRLSEYVYGANDTSLTLVLDFLEFDAAAPAPNVFDVPAYCDKQPLSRARTGRSGPVSPAQVPLIRTGAAAKAVAAMSGQLGIHWKCDICKAAAETIISVGCSAGSAVCGPFAEVCEAMCEGGCLGAGCSDWACKKFGFC